MFGPKKTGRLSRVAKALESGGGGTGGDTLSPNSVRSMINAFRKPLGLPLYVPDDTTEAKDPSPVNTDPIVLSKTKAEGGSESEVENIDPLALNIDKTEAESNPPAISDSVELSKCTEAVKGRSPLTCSAALHVEKEDVKTDSPVITDSLALSSCTTSMKIEATEIAESKACTSSRAAVEIESLVVNDSRALTNVKIESPVLTAIDPVLSKYESDVTELVKDDSPVNVIPAPVLKKYESNVTYRSQVSQDDDESPINSNSSTLNNHNQSKRTSEMTISKQVTDDLSSLMNNINNLNLNVSNSTDHTLPNYHNQRDSLSANYPCNRTYVAEHCTAEIERRPSYAVLGTFSTPNVRSGGLPPSGSAVKTAKQYTTKKKPPNVWKLTTEKVLGISYLLLKQLGKGGCGEVYLVMENDTRELYALKKVNMQLLDAVGVQECINEVTMLLDLKNTELVIHIVDWEIDSTSNTLKIVMEYGQCDLAKTITSRSNSLIKIKSCWESMLQIVQTIHSKGIVHADLKPANFVWVAGRLKIIDFGIANRLQMDVTSIQTYNPKGTLNFMSPESIRPDAYGRAKIGPKSDIWSLGCILYMMVYGYAPFHGFPNQISKMQAIMAGTIEFPSLPSHLNDHRILDVLKLCFQLDTRDRADVVTLLQHPFLS